jgi:HK97 family phage major capsid protein
LRQFGFPLLTVKRRQSSFGCLRFFVYVGKTSLFKIGVLKMPVSLINAKQLREERAPIVKSMQELISKAAVEKRSMTAEEKTKWDSLDIEQRSKLEMAEQIEHLYDVEGVHDLQRELNERKDYDSKRKDDDSVTTQDVRNAWRAFGLAGNSHVDIPNDWIKSAKKCGINPVGRSINLKLLQQAPTSIEELRNRAEQTINYQQRATTYQTITTTAGGNIIQNEVMQELEIALLAYGGMRNVARVIRTETGATLPFPTMDDSSNKSAILAINTAADIESLVFGQFTLGAYKFTTKRVMVPIELMQDSAFNLPQLIGTALGVRAARGTNYYFTIGTTAGTQPVGAVTDAIQGSTGADVNTVTYNELVTLLHSVDPDYRSDPSCCWMFNDNTLGRLRRLTDSYGQPLWQPGVELRAPDRLLGYPYQINQDMVSIASSTTGSGAAKALIFGAFNRYIIRDVRDIMFMRLDERYAEMGMVAFLAFHRHDGKTIQASTVNAPIKYFITKST